MNIKKPIIGITLDHEVTGSFAIYPWFALREGYFQAVEKAGGIPIALPYCHDAISHYLELVQGLIVPGGAHDIDPHMYGDPNMHPKTSLKNYRHDFDAAIMRAALSAHKPVLGICAGQQMMNVLYGGTLFQHVPDMVKGALNHKLSASPDAIAHDVIIQKNTLLYEIAGIDKIQVNSTHHQAVKDVGHNLVVNAIAPDGVIEGIEDPNARFCMGIEWHPEYHTSSIDHLIFKRFIQASSHI